MRFVFTDDSSESESSERARIVARMDRFWASLCEQLGAAVQPDPERLARDAAALAQKVAAELELEVVVERDGRCTVALSPGGERRLRPLIRELVARAPETPGFRFVEWSPARSFGDVCAALGREHGIDLGRARARAGFSRGHLLELVLYARELAGRDRGAATEAAERAAELLLGERLLEDWVGRISAEPLAGDGPLRVLRDDAAPTFELAELAGRVAGAVEGVVAGLPDEPRGTLPRDGWTLFELEPELAMDWSAQDDVALASSADPEAHKCFLEGAPFSSSRFSRCAERFAYLKLEAGSSSFEDRLRDRTALEDRLDQELGRAKLGGVNGNGLGLRYSYVDLALVDLPRALPLVRDVARACGAPRRSWILFCDSDWADEWLGVHPTAPAPP